jgi:transposase
MLMRPHNGRIDGVLRVLRRPDARQRNCRRSGRTTRASPIADLPNRISHTESQLNRWDMVDLEGLLPADHRARIVWSFVESLDLWPLYDQIFSRESKAGRPAADPAVLTALWLYATIEGVGSARELERLAQSDAAYRWLAGGVPVNYHGLADFRVEGVEILDRLLTQSVTALIGEGLVRLSQIAVDGTKIRASASKMSFTTDAKLLKIEAAVAERLTALKQELTDDPGASNRRRSNCSRRSASRAPNSGYRRQSAIWFLGMYSSTLWRCWRGVFGTPPNNSSCRRTCSP